MYIYNSLYGIPNPPVLINSVPIVKHIGIKGHAIGTAWQDCHCSNWWTDEKKLVKTVMVNNSIKYQENRQLLLVFTYCQHFTRKKKTICLHNYNNELVNFSSVWGANMILQKINVCFMFYGLFILLNKVQLWNKEQHLIALENISINN